MLTVLPPVLRQVGYASVSHDYASASHDYANADYGYLNAGHAGRGWRLRGVAVR
jgi:hypothetical protein